MDKILAIMIEDPYWMYYVKYRKYLAELNVPFQNKIDFVVDSSLEINADRISQYPVVVFFHRDPLKFLYPDVYEYAKKIEKICKDKNIRLINNPDALSNSVKSIQLSMLSQKGFRVAKSFPFEDASELQSVDKSYYPLFIRNNSGHDSDNETMEGPFETYESLLSNYKGVSLENKRHLDGKVAIQWIDTKGHDGLYRRYRAFVCGENAVTGNLYISDSWYIHGANNTPHLSEKNENDEFVNRTYSKEEIGFFVDVNNALGLEFSAIDYSYSADGEIVIWEANPHPAFPAWVDKEPSRTKNTVLLTDFYSKILSNYSN